jgi:hypothetical protein
MFSGLQKLVVKVHLVGVVIHDGASWKRPVSEPTGPVLHEGARGLDSAEAECETTISDLLVHQVTLGGTKNRVLHEPHEGVQHDVHWPDLGRRRHIL